VCYLRCSIVPYQESTFIDTEEYRAQTVASIRGTILQSCIPCYWKCALIKTILRKIQKAPSNGRTNIRAHEYISKIRHMREEGLNKSRWIRIGWTNINAF